MITMPKAACGQPLALPERGTTEAGESVLLSPVLRLNGLKVKSTVDEQNYQWSEHLILLNGVGVI